MSFATADYDYTLPPEAIATHPVTPRDAARLLIYNRQNGEITHSTFADLPKFLPENTALILNDTKVIKARIFGRKASGGECELLLIKPLEANRFLVNIRGKVREETVLHFDRDLSATVRELLEDGSRIVTFTLSGKEADFDALLPILDAIGHIPLPPYIKREDTDQDSEDYQTVFAKEAGSVAAPTASLHFTPELLTRIKAEHPAFTVTLHVGMGTFKGVEAEDIRLHTMHSERFAIPTDTQTLLDTDKPLVAVGMCSWRGSDARAS